MSLGATKSGEESKHTAQPFPWILFAKAHLVDYYDKFISFHKGDGDYLIVASESEGGTKIKYVLGASEEAVVILRTMMESMTIDIFEEMSKKT